MGSDAGVTAGRPMPPVSGARLWGTAQWSGLIVTLVLLAGLLNRPETTLSVFWNLIVPILPASFLINPAIWRNVCPLATLNMLPGFGQGSRPLSARAAVVAGAGGIVLLLVLVPARHVLFNESGLALTIAILGFGVVALMAGTMFDAKAGFCNAICPVLPVERLYGQHPLVEVPNARCAPCTVCTRKGCPDLSTRSIEQLIGSHRTSAAWLRTSHGAFAAAFPGFIIGYFLQNDGPLSAAVPAYGSALGGALTSYVLVSVIASVSRIRASSGLRVLAAIAIGLYYWYAAPRIGEALGASTVLAWLIRAAALMLLIFWMASARAQLHPRRAGPEMPGPTA